MLNKANTVFVDSPNNVVVRHVGNNKLSERRLGILTQTELNSTFESNAVFNYFSRLKLELSSAHVRFDVWTGPYNGNDGHNWQTRAGVFGGHCWPSPNEQIPSHFEECRVDITLAIVHYKHSNTAVRGKVEKWEELKALLEWGQPVHWQSSLMSLHPFVEDGLIRIGGPLTAG